MCHDVTLPKFSQIRSAENPLRPVLDFTARAFTERFYGALFVGKQLGCTELTLLPLTYSYGGFLK